LIVVPASNDVVVDMTEIDSCEKTFRRKMRLIAILQQMESEVRWDSPAPAESRRLRPSCTNTITTRRQ